MFGWSFNVSLKNRWVKHNITRCITASHQSLQNDICQQLNSRKKIVYIYRNISLCDVLLFNLFTKAQTGQNDWHERFLCEVQPLPRPIPQHIKVKQV